MEMIIDFPGGAKVDAHFNSFTVHTDQPVRAGGENSAPSPFEVFLASLGTCAGIYIVGFCRQRDLSTEGIRLVQTAQIDRMTGSVYQIDIEIQVPSTFPPQYHDALIRSAELCKVKKTIENPPKFKVTTKEI